MLNGKRNITSEILSPLYVFRGIHFCHINPDIILYPKWTHYTEEINREIKLLNERKETLLQLIFCPRTHLSSLISVKVSMFMYVHESN